VSQTKSTYKYLFGPVASRRYGRSLGVDLAIPKTCSLNCIFCQIGETPSTTIKLSEKPPVNEVLKELARWIQSGDQTDFITVAGSGEPTLHTGFGDVLNFIRDETEFKSLLLSNGTLFFLEDIRNKATSADIVKLSLHAWDQSSFTKITRADPALDFDKILDGFRRFRDIYSGKIDLEVFVIPGINDKAEQMEKIAHIARSFSPDSVYLNSAVRPPADSTVKEASPDLIEKLSLVFGELAVKKIYTTNEAILEYSATALIELISRHPASLDQLAKQFNLSHDVMLNELKILEAQNRMQLTETNGKIFAMPII
jgi:wyosine [tRNA(Phe)-imidazoG37] synthetase (radical SAM superfamily)